MTHPKQGPVPGHTGTLVNVDVASLVNNDGVGLVQVLATGGNEKRALRLAGQLTPAIAIALGHNLLEAAEAAVSDASLFAVAREITEAQAGDLELDELEAKILEVASLFVSSARRHRGQLHRNRATLDEFEDAVAAILEDEDEELDDEASE